jgi:hypothetical protein
MNEWINEWKLKLNSTISLLWFTKKKSLTLFFMFIPLIIQNYSIIDGKNMNCNSKKKKKKKKKLYKIIQIQINNKLKNIMVKTIWKLCFFFDHFFHEWKSKKNTELLSSFNEKTTMGHLMKLMLLKRERTKCQKRSIFIFMII